MHQSTVNNLHAIRPRERRPRDNREHREAVLFMRLVRIHEFHYPSLAYLFHVPNGGARARRTAAYLKAEGVRKGVPDYLWPVRRIAGEVGLAIELKARGGRLEREQKDWVQHLAGQGWRTVVAYGWEEAWAAVCEYGQIRNPLKVAA